jgi:hypothetical protein
MREEEILNILSYWNFWTTDLDTGIERADYLRRAEDLLGDVNIVAEVGVRRSGKSYLTRQLLSRLIKKGLNKNATLIIDLNDERFQRDQNLLTDIYNTYRKNICLKDKAVIVIDEPQEIEGWERFVRGVSERGEARFIVTGSSSRLLSSEFSTLLGGRHISLQIFPLSFREYLKFKHMEVASKLDIGRNLLQISKALDEYIVFGGFPAVVSAVNKMELLNSYVDTILVKDVTFRYKIRESEKLRVIAKFYLTNIGHSITYNSISRFTRIPVKTVERYSNYIESAFLLFFVKRFSFSLKEQENSPRKVYSIDNGLAVASGFSSTMGRGALIENTVAEELKRRGIESYYWKDTVTDKEVDFVVRTGSKFELIQVADLADDPYALEREVNALKTAMKRMGLGKSQMIVYSRPKEETLKYLNDNGIEVKQLWQWLLEDGNK